MPQPAPFYQRLIRSFGASVLLHAMVISVFVYGFGKNQPSSNQGLHPNTAFEWLEFGTKVSSSKPQKKLKQIPNKTDTELKTAAPPSMNDTSEAAAAPLTAIATTEPTTAEARESAETRYVTDLAHLLDRNKQYPRESILREQEGRVVVSVSIDRDGIVHEKSVATPSPFHLLNLAALETVTRIGKFPAPPVALLHELGAHGTGSLRLKIPLSFQIDRR